MSVEYNNDLPIIKLMVIDNNYYLYDTYTNHILKISKSHFQEIAHLSQIGVSKYKNLNLNSKAYKDIILLINKGYLKSSFINEIEHPYTEYLETLLARGMSSLVLQVTQNCNFKCRYCLYATDNSIERNHEKKEMPREIAFKSVDYLFEHSADSNEISILFYGGEPLLNYELIKDIVRYSKKKFKIKKLSYYLTTNASILTDEIIDFLAYNDFNLTISLDGPRRIQNNHRKFLITGNDTFDIVLGNINKLRSKYNEYFNTHVGFLSVVFADDSIQDIFDFYNELQIPLERIHIQYANTSGIDYWTNIYGTRDVSDRENPNHPRNFSYNLHEKAFNKSHPNYKKWHHNGPCVPGFKKLFVDIDGFFYPCEKCVENSALTIGNINTGIDLKKAEEILNIGKLSAKECKKCWAVRFCDICVTKCIDIEANGISASQKEVSCQTVKEYSKRFLAMKIKKEEQTVVKYE